MSINTKLILLAIAVLLGIQANATKVNNCDGKPNPDTKSVTVSNCDVPPCHLKRKNTSLISQKFTADHDIQEITTRAWAKKWGIWIAYPDVDSVSACDKIYHAADNSPAPCPLKKGVEYIYKHELFVSPWYPAISTNVQWALEANGKDVTCFQIEAEISS